MGMKGLQAELNNQTEEVALQAKNTGHEQCQPDI